MADMLSHSEIDALLNKTPIGNLSAKNENVYLELSSQEIEALTEIENISMGTSATTLCNLIGQKVTIDNPMLTITSWEKMSEDYIDPYIAINVEYTRGLLGKNLLMIKDLDVKVILDLMMGGDGKSNLISRLSDLHLSEISEAINQMLVASSTSLSSVFDKKIEISTPKAVRMEFGKGQPYLDIDDLTNVVVITFKMVIGNLIESEIIKIIPLPYAKELVLNLFDSAEGFPRQQNNRRSSDINSDEAIKRKPAVKATKFESYDENNASLEGKNINLIMDVPLVITVELGRTQRLIKDVLELSPGSVIQLDKIAGEPSDILVNGKAIAKGEIVLVDDCLGVKITDIIHPYKRL